MPTVRPPQGLEEADYETIEAAVMETERGRWFLLEHARRSREAETAKVLDAIGQIEALVRGQPSSPVVERHEISALLAAVEERLLDLAWMMKSQGVDTAFCAVIDREAVRIGRALDEDSLEALRKPLPSLPALSVSALAAQPKPLPEQDAVAAPVVTLEAPTPEPDPEPEPLPLRPDALGFLDRMSPREKLRFFA